MFCPYCGVKNDPGLSGCFICKKKLPALDAEAPVQPRRQQFVPRSNQPVSARLGDRFLAVLLDSILLCALTVLALAFACTHQAQINKLPLTPKALFFWDIVLILLGGFLYHWFLEGLFGATFGKAIVGIEVEHYGDGPFLASAVRNLLRVLDGFPIYFPGLLVAAYSRDHRRLGDMIANTTVMQSQVSKVKRTFIFLLWLLLLAGCVWLVWNLMPIWFHRVATQLRKIR